MDLSVKDMAGLLNVSKKTIYRMIKNASIPCFRVGGQWRFDKKEITSWIEDVRAFNRKSLRSRRPRNEEAIPLSEFFSRGGIYDDISGESKEEIILACIKLIQEKLPNLLNIEELFSSIMEREALCPTSVGHGIAFPHPKTFGKFTDISYIALCRLKNPIPFSSLDNELIDTLLFIFPKSERRFLRIQAKLMRLLRDNYMLTVIKSEASHDNILKTISEKETEIFGVRTNDN